MAVTGVVPSATGFGLRLSRQLLIRESTLRLVSTRTHNKLKQIPE